MAASSTAVSVLTPNGRRQTVKVSPNTPLLQVLEDVCKKHGFNPDDHGLKFQRNVLDLTLQWRFASLPNNAKLEVVPSTRQGAGAESMVRLALQLEDGSRLQGSFSSGQSLLELLDHFPQTRLSDIDPESTPVCVYMRDEVSGVQALRKTTLKSLGLTGGSAIVRYILKKKINSPPKVDNEPLETAAMTTDAAAVPSPSPQQSSAENKSRPDAPAVPMETTVPPSQSPEMSISQTQPVRQKEVEPAPEPQPTVCPKSSSVVSPGWPEPQEEEQPGPSQECHTHAHKSVSFVPFSGGGQRLGGSGASSATSAPSPPSAASSPPKAKKAKPSHEIKRSASDKNRAGDVEEGEEYLEPVDREALVYHLDTGAHRHGDDEEDLPDEFFEVTINDVRKRFAQLKSERRALEEAPLMTKTLRESQMKEKMDRYPKVVLRIQFPDRHILQGFFRPLETVGSLRDFVSSHLEDPQLRFYLFIAPPKTILADPSATLFQANLFPAALVYFGSDEKTDYHLQRALLGSKVSALRADELITSCMPRSPAPSCSSEPCEDLSPPSEGCTPAASQQGAAEDGANQHGLTAPKPVRTDPAKVPKWLKLPGKK